MPKSAPELIAQAKAVITTCDPARAAQRIAKESDLLLVDVREPHEHAQGAVPGAVNIPRGLLELKIQELTGDAQRPLLLYCGAGGRAALAAKTLQEMGYRNVTAVDARFEDLQAACAAGPGSARSTARDST